MNEWGMVVITIIAGFGCGVAIFNLFTLQNFSNRLCEIENKLADMKGG